MIMGFLRQHIFALLLGLLAVQVAGLGQKLTLTFGAADSGLQLGAAGLAPVLRLDSADWPGVIRTANDVAQDFGRVLGTNGTVLLTNSTTSSSNPRVIIAGTIGKSSMINSLVSAGKIDVSSVKGQWESFTSSVVSDPMTGVSSALVIAGSDKRGTIYGLYDISEQIGVSPWYWWADVTPKTKQYIWASPTTKVQGPPSVKYRGLFLNDEQPALTNWANQFYGKASNGDPGFLTAFHSRIFELLLRQRANYFWPAMWASMFYVDDSNNGPLADMYGIVMGTSHTEPMARASNEQSKYCSGNWDWASNKNNVIKFFKDGISRAKNWETLWTMGMRGNGDAASPTLTSASLQDVITNQQSLLQSGLGVTNLTTVPQVWTLYKEVGAYFQAGMKVPDNIVLMWSDDNVGNILRLPMANETSRVGGSGIYYHFDYVGSPRDYKWINTIQLSKTWQQMSLAYSRDARQVWIANVGDLKALELPLSHFLDLAYDMNTYSAPESTDLWLQQWATREWGTDIASSAASIMSEYGRLIIRRKYEQLSTSPFAYSVGSYDEAERVLSEWAALRDRAQQVYNSLDAARQTSFYEMVLHPTLAGYTVHEIYIKAAMSAWYQKQHRTSTNKMAADAVSAFAADKSITAAYHALAGGKWNHMMDQVHIGYTTWSDPAQNTMPTVSYVSDSNAPATGIMGVSIQGSDTSAPGDPALTALQMDPYMPGVRYIDVYTRTNGSFTYTMTSNVSWVTLSSTTGTLSSTGTSDARINITVNWAAAPSGSSGAAIQVSRSGGTATTVTVPLFKPAAPPSSFSGFVESNKGVAMEAEHFASSTTSSAGVTYKVIPNYGRTLSGVSLFPLDIPSQTTTSGAQLSYAFYSFTTTSTATITFYFGAGMNSDPSRPLKGAYAMDSGASTTFQPVPMAAWGATPSGWEDAVNANTWKYKTGNINLPAGSHTLKVWLLEPGFVLQRIEVNLGGILSSYLGPPESVMLGSGSSGGNASTIITAPATSMVGMTSQPATAASMAVTTTPVPATAVTVSRSCVTPAGQCGGEGWTGPTCCVSGFSCQTVATSNAICLQTTPS